MNKRILTLTLLLLSSFFCHQTSAQVPHRFNYQSALRDASGDVAANEAVTMRFTIRHVNGGSVAYQEKHDVLTNEFGLVNVDIGTGDVLQFSWNNLIWEGFDYLLQVEVDLGNGFVDMGTSAFDSVPFSILSEKAINMNLGDLYDVETFMGVSEGDVLRFNSDENWWEPQPLPAMVDGVWSSNATNAWRIGGNIGIGTSTPVYGLHMHNKQGLHLTTTSTGSTFLDGFYLGQEDPGTVTLVNFENGPMTFHTNFFERMRIAGDGNIGIGTQAPVAPLHLANVNVGSDVYTKWTTPITGHTTTDGAHVGVNTVGQMVIDQKENYDILVKRNGSTKLTVNSTGADVNGTLTTDDADVNGELNADDITTGTVTAVSSDVTSANAFITTTENLYINSATGTGNRPLYATAAGQVYADADNSTKYMAFMGTAFHFSDECNDNFVVYENWEIDHPAIRGNGDCGRAYCAISLPQGAVVTKITARFKDDADGQNFVLWLRRYDISVDETWTNLASVSSVPSNDYVAASTTTITAATVNNNGHAYMLVLGYGTDDITATGWMSMLSASVEYYMP